MTKHAHGLLGAKWTFSRVVSGKAVKVEEGTKYYLLVEAKIEIVAPCRPSIYELHDAVVLDHKEPVKSWRLLSFDI